jgi:hypothetical protein
MLFFSTVPLNCSVFSVHSLTVHLLELNVCCLGCGCGCGCGCGYIGWAHDGGD